MKDTDNKETRIKYTFPYWGPFLFHTDVPKTITDYLLKQATNKKSYHKKLAGHIKKQFIYPENIFMNCLKPYLTAYLKEASIYYRSKISIDKGIKLIGPPWINYMKSGEINPPHIHDKGDFSMILFLQVPKTLKKENINFTGNSCGPGSVEFIYGENRFLNISIHGFFPQVGNLLMFPANLRHWVYPFKSKGERISISANLKQILEF